MPREIQPSPHEVIFDYAIRLIVAGTRGYDDYEFFSKAIWDTIALYDGQSILFISGAARSGADAMIIRFCKENGLPWVEFPADWDKLGKSAGYARNAKMAKVGTHLLTFYDGVSRGTRHMVDVATKRSLHITTILIDIKRTFDHGWQSQGSGKGNPRVHREAHSW